ncbi:hypothetical protein HPB51_013715 [Rhipicephalus microplus]|uniref:Uncharacterized protein n=1 Tax=Rhipicephalus microplus TaxID=6941 RepID=A0A9J6F3G0_RHIMP|nr:hypothetical protein HPB51_013715 [Rhipicephalus microplus]
MSRPVKIFAQSQRSLDGDRRIDYYSRSGCTTCASSRDTLPTATVSVHPRSGTNAAGVDFDTPAQSAARDVRCCWPDYRAPQRSRRPLPGPPAHLHVPLSLRSKSSQEMWGRRIAVEEDCGEMPLSPQGSFNRHDDGGGEEGCRKAWPTPLAWQRQRRQPVNERFTLNADFHTGRAGLAPASTFAKRAQPSVAPSSAATLAGGASFLASVSDAGGERTPPPTVLEEKKPARGPTTPHPKPSDQTEKTWRRADDAEPRSRAAAMFILKTRASALPLPAAVRESTLLRRVHIRPCPATTGFASPVRVSS